MLVSVSYPFMNRPGTDRPVIDSVGMERPVMDQHAPARSGACARHEPRIVTVCVGADIDVTALRLMTPRSPLVSGASPFMPGHSP